MKSGSFASSLHYSFWFEVQRKGCVSHAGAVCLPASCGSEQCREFYNVSVMFVSFLDGTESSEMRYGNDENDF